MSSAVSTPAASVAGTGAMPSGAPSPSAELENQQGTSSPVEGAGGASPEPEGGAAVQTAPEPGTEAGKPGADQGAEEDGRVVPAKWRAAFTLRQIFRRREVVTRERIERYARFFDLEGAHNHGRPVL